MKTTTVHKKQLHSSTTKTSADISDLLRSKRSDDMSFSEKSLGTIHEFYLVGEIEEPSEYVDWFNTIRNATANDIIKIYINSPGGDLFTAIQFMRVMRESSAPIVVSVEGSCMSAATVILLCGDDFEITPHSLFMVHQYTSGYFGRGNHVRDQIKVESRWSEDFFSDIYKHFLSTSEIKAMVEGQDLWFTHAEATERLTKRLKMLREERAAEEAAKEGSSDETDSE